MRRPIVIVLLTIALVFVCLGIGAVIFFANGFQTNNPFDKLSIPSVLEESKTLKVDAKKPIKLKLDSAAGNVTVTGADVETVQIDVVKTAFDSTQARADEEVKGIKYTVEQNGNSITIKYELPKSMNFNNKVNTVDFTISVPNETTVDAETHFGEVSVSNTKGKVEIKNDFGDITAENIEGGLTAKTNSGNVDATSIVAGSENIDLRSDFGSVTLKKADSHDITLDSNSGTITLSEVRAKGEITTKTDFGNTKFENGSADSLHAETNSGKVSLVKINVSKQIFVKDDFGDINLKQAFATSYDLHTNSGSVTVDGAKGELKADTDFGDITITNAQSVTLTAETNSGTIEFSGSLGVGPHLITSDFGGIDISLPSDAKLTVDLATDFGNIKSDLPITVTLNGSSNSDGDQIVGSINGGGEQLTAKTSSGTVEIHTSR